MAAQKSDEDKLGTSVTYVDPNKTGQPIKMGEISFIPGEAVNLTELLPEEEAKAMAKRLANNASFQVEGGRDHQKLAEANAKHEEEAAKKRQEIAEKQQREASRQGEPSPPKDWKGPDQPKLEHEAEQRRRVK